MGELEVVVLHGLVFWLLVLGPIVSGITISISEIHYI